MNGKNVLVVDDDTKNMYALSSYLETFEMNIYKASCGLEAMKVLEIEYRVIGLILMDIIMPDMDGYEAIRQIRENHQYDHIPILAVTAKAMEGDRERCLKAGADNYISKPIDVKELIGKINQLIY